MIERSKDGNLDPHQDNPQLELEVFNHALLRNDPLKKVLYLLRLLGVVGRAMITEDGQPEELWNSHLKVGHLFLGGWFQ